MLESKLHRTLPVHVASVTQMNKFSNWFKYGYALWHYINSCPLNDQKSFQMLRQMGCHYDN